MNALFVNSTIKPNQGWTDFGYYVDGSANPCSGQEFEEMVADDEAYFTEVFVNYRGGVHIRLRSDSRRVAAEVDDEIGFRTRGLERTLYQATGSPRLPSTYEEKNDSNESLEAFANYALEHGRARGIEIENVNWDDLLEDESGL